MFAPPKKFEIENRRVRIHPTQSVFIRESVDSLCRDGADKTIVRVKKKKKGVWSFSARKSSDVL